MGRIVPCFVTLFGVKLSCHGSELPVEGVARELLSFVHAPC